MVTLNHLPEESILSISDHNELIGSASDESFLTSFKHQLFIESQLKMYMGNERYMQLSRIDDKSGFPESVSLQVRTLSIFTEPRLTIWVISYVPL